MDFKDLLSLAKDNQSFAQKKFKRDLLEKNKNSKASMVSDTAVKSFMAKKKKMEEERKAAMEAERRKRVEARLESSLGKKKSSKQNSSISERKVVHDSMKSGRISSLSDKRMTSQKKGPGLQEQKSKESFQIPKKGGIQKSNKFEQSGSTVKSVPSIPGKSECNLSLVTSEKPVIKQHRRRKGTESSFEWSGSTTASDDNLRKSFTKGKDIGRKKAGGSLSFTELMNVAKQQKDKQPTLKKEIADPIKISPKTDPGQSSSKDNPSRKVKPHKGTVGKPDPVIAKIERQKDIPKPKGKVFTQTIDVRSNYPQNNNMIKGGRDGRSSVNGLAKFPRPEAAIKRRKVFSIDEELEMERQELERKRNLLRKKMQGGLSQDEEDDLRDMESNFRQISAEEARSARIAKLEDEIERRKELMEEKSAKRKKQ
eukprot:gene11602-21839_t